LTTAGVLEPAFQTTGGTRFMVDSNVKPEEKLVGHAKVTLSPERLMLMAGDGLSKKAWVWPEGLKPKPTI